MATIPWKSELHNVLRNEYPKAERQDKQRWTNCAWFFLNYLKEWPDGKKANIRFFVKKGFVRAIPIERFEEEMKLVKDTFGNLIPNQSFIRWEDWIIYVFCSPVNIKCDIFEKDNFEYVLELAKINKRFLKQLKYFVRQFRKLESSWHILDLHWAENLIISDDNKLFYLDSFLVFYDAKHIREDSEKNIKILEWIITEAEKFQSQNQE